MPPRDLPGFYWDPQKNRYFPAHSPATSASSPLHPNFPPQRHHQPLQVPNSPNAPVITSVYRRSNIVGRIQPTFSRLSQLHQCVDHSDTSSDLLTNDYGSPARSQILCSRVLQAPVPHPSEAFLTSGSINAFNVSHPVPSQHPRRESRHRLSNSKMTTPIL